MLPLHNESQSAVKHPGTIHDCIWHKGISAIRKQEKKSLLLERLASFGMATLLYSCNTLILVPELDPNPNHSKKDNKKGSIPHTPYWPGSAYADSVCTEEKTPEGTLLRGPASRIQIWVKHLHLTGFLMAGTHMHKNHFLQLPLPSTKSGRPLTPEQNPKRTRGKNQKEKKEWIKTFCYFSAYP